MTLRPQPIDRIARAGVVALAALWLPLAAAQSNDEALGQARCLEVPEISRQLARITGLPLRHPVPCNFIDKEQVNAYLKKRLKEESTPEEIRVEELTLKKFGLVPADFDLAASTVDLLTEQAAAFYDFDRKRLFITESTPGETEEPVLAHELAHALADQKFGLGKFMRKGRN